jgi:murein DD-endopeptidase MepM/ murein hydrolase activator NlpD
MNYKSLLVSSITFFSLVSAFAESNIPLNSKEAKLNLFEMKRKIEDQNREILALTKEMNQIEVNLGVHNKKYLKMADVRLKLEEELALAKRNADNDNLNLKKNYNETKTVLMGILINKLEKTESPSDLLARKVLVRDLQSRLVELDNLMKSNNQIQSAVNEINARLDSSLQTEKELVSIMNELEDRKKELRATIENQNAKKASELTEFNELKNKMAIENDAIKRLKKKEIVSQVQVTEEIKIPAQNLPLKQAIGYRSPVYMTQGIEYNQKGVTFKFQGKNEVLAPGPGRVAYTGTLANYGNVVMIDHGNDTRTVLLGQFDYAVKNGDAVKESQIIGYTNPKTVNGLGDGKIYFEIRKNNLAQNTYLLLDKSTIKRN